MCQAFYIHPSMIPFNPHNNLANVVLNKFRNENNFRTQTTKITQTMVEEPKPIAHNIPASWCPHPWITPSTEETAYTQQGTEAFNPVAHKEISLVNKIFHAGLPQDKPSDQNTAQGYMVIIASLETLNQRHPDSCPSETVRQ